MTRQSHPDDELRPILRDVFAELIDGLPPAPVDASSNDAALGDTHRPPTGSARRIAAVAAGCLVLVGGLVLVAVRRSDDPATAPSVSVPPANDRPAGSAPTPWVDGVRMIVYVDAGASDGSLQFIRDGLAQLSNIVDADGIRYLGPEESLVQARRLLVDDPVTAELLNVANIPTAFYVTTVDGVAYDELAGAAASIQTWPDVVRVDIDPERQPVTPAIPLPQEPTASTVVDVTTSLTDSVADSVRLSMRESGDVGPFATYDAFDEPVGLPIGHDVLVLADDATYVLDTDSLTWRRAADPPTPVVLDDGAIIWTGSELLLWGAGRESGLAYSADSDSWRVLPEAPIEPRLPNVTGFIEGEFFVWGGVRFDDPIEPPEDSPTLQTVRHFDDAAAYDPKSDTWRRLTSVAPGDGAERIWTLADGTHATVFRTPDGDLQAATYDPTSDQWTVDDTTIPGGWDMTTVHAGADLITLVSTRPPPSDSAVPVLWRWSPEQGWQELPTHPFGESPVICTNQLQEVDAAIVVWWCSQIALLDDGTWSTPIPLEHGTFIRTDDGLLRANSDTILTITVERS